MSHYFTYDPSLKSNIRTISYKICDKNIALQSDSGVFSNKEIDKGSLIFINESCLSNLIKFLIINAKVFPVYLPPYIIV